MFTDDLLVHPEEFVTPIRSRSARRDPTIQLEWEGLELNPTSTCTTGLFLLLPAASAAPPLTDTGNHVQEVVQALVHRRGDDFHLGEGVGHRVDAQLCHQQRDQDDLILPHLVVLHSHQPHKCTYVHAQVPFWVLSEVCSRKRVQSNDRF